MHKKQPSVEKEPIIIEGREDPGAEKGVRSTVGIYLGVAAVAAVVGFASGYIVGLGDKSYFDQEKALYVGNINDDPQERDVVIGKECGKAIYLEQKNGTYRRLDSVEAERAREIRERAEANLRDIVE